MHASVASAPPDTEVLDLPQNSTLGGGNSRQIRHVKNYLYYVHTSGVLSCELCTAFTIPQKISNGIRAKSKISIYNMFIESTVSSRSGRARPQRPSGWRLTAGRSIKAHDWSRERGIVCVESALSVPAAGRRHPFAAGIPVPIKLNCWIPRRSCTPTGCIWEIHTPFHCWSRSRRSRVR